jgi:hypothetical protein
VVRGANAIDRYSLALQLIQVYPIILGGAAVLIPVRWLRILVALLGLLIWTMWAIVRERSAEKRLARAGINSEDHDEDDHEVALVESTVEQTPVATATTTTPITRQVQGVRVDIWVHPADSVPRNPAGRRTTHPRPNQSLPPNHRGLPKPRSHRHQPAYDPEPEERPGIAPMEMESRWATKP